ncbi:hypothetical protein ACFU7D_01970 [Nocardioides sp. NPDC057577]|uniref:hypothetical protein n=1 Tax=Nocardioides sp. NPDC057577 TaxID=3346171 RepID=UPI00367289E7
MARYVKLTIQDDMTDDEYADLANTVWMVLRNTQYDFHVEHDGRTPVGRLNASWAKYGDDAAWE